VCALIEGVEANIACQLIEAILGRLEGKPKQQLDVNDISDDIRKRSTADLRFYLEHCYWPEESQERTLEAGEAQSDDAPLASETELRPPPRRSPNARGGNPHCVAMVRINSSEKRINTKSRCHPAFE
jgi:hypothetical protein